MLCKTKGIVLHYIKYKETSIIAKIYTENFGLKSYVQWSVVKIDLFGSLQDIMIIDLAIKCYLEHDCVMNVLNSVNICAKCV